VASCYLNGNLPNSLVRADVQIQPLLLTPLPEDVREIGLVPDLEIGPIDGISGLEVLEQSIQEQVIVGPIAVIARPDRRCVRPVGAPDVVRQNLELSSVLAARLVVRESRVETRFVLGLAPDPSASRCVQLGSTGTAKTEGNVGVEVVRDLIWLVWDAVNHSGSKVFGFSGQLLWVDRSGCVEVLRSHGFAGDQGGTGQPGHKQTSCGHERHDRLLVIDCVMLIQDIVDLKCYICSS
jgi:hypothetical protein